jgi:hypothetical protein
MVLGAIAGIIAILRGAKRRKLNLQPDTIVVGLGNALHCCQACRRGSFPDVLSVIPDVLSVIIVHLLRGHFEAIVHELIMQDDRQAGHHAMEWFIATPFGDHPVTPSW